MDHPEVLEEPVRSKPIIPAIAALISIVGLADSVYLTVHHYTSEPVPCSLIDGCEQVLTSQWSELGGIVTAIFGSAVVVSEGLASVPLAAFGAAAYFVAFSLALLAAFGDSRMWKLFGVQATVMAAVSAYLIYVQGALIGAFCQFCLISALSSTILFVLFIISVFRNTTKSRESV